LDFCFFFNFYIFGTYQVFYLTFHHSLQKKKKKKLIHKKKKKNVPQGDKKKIKIGIKKNKTDI